jgi:hypothetical protein
MHKKLFLGGLALLMGVMAGCTPAIYSHTFTTKYDAQGNVIGMEESEGIVQQDPSTSPMKVNVTKRSKLEK